MKYMAMVTLNCSYNSTIVSIANKKKPIYIQKLKIIHFLSRDPSLYIQQFPYLRFLYLSGNRIGDKGAEALSKALGSVPQLQTLNLFDNQIGEKGRQILNKIKELRPRINIYYLN